MNQMVSPTVQPRSEARRPAPLVSPYLNKLVVDLESLDQADAVLKAQREGWSALTAREVRLCQQAVEMLAGSISQRKATLFR